MIGDENESSLSTTSTMVSSSREASSASDLKADDPETQVETLDLISTAEHPSSTPSLSEAGAHSESNTPPPYEEPSPNDNADASYPGSGDMPCSYSVNDGTPSISQSNSTNNRYTLLPLHLTILVLGIIFAALAVWQLPNFALEPACIRDGWDKEFQAHEALRAEWAHERADTLYLRADLQREKAEWEHERVAQVQRRQEEEIERNREIQAHDALRAEWVVEGDIQSQRVDLQREKAELESERSAYEQRRQEEKLEWEREIQAHEALRADWASESENILSLHAKLQREKAEWKGQRAEEKAELQREKAEWKRQHAEEKEELQREKAEWKRQRAEEKRRQEGENARVRAGFRWENPTPDQRCLRHNTRGYTARLANVPRSYDPVQACKETAIKIPGVKIEGRPLKCEDQGCSGVFGHWIAESGEPICATYFKSFDDKGCTSPGSRRRRIKSRLENVQPEDDWRKMCSTTPTTFRQQHFPKPDTCEISMFGVWGVWDIKDDKC